MFSKRTASIATTGISHQNGTALAPDAVACPTPRPTIAPGSRSAVLDGLRFLAAALIVVYHYQDEGPWPLARLSPVFARGYLATDFFLILSGYVLGRAYGRKVAAGAVSDEQFLWRRVLRVWPAHLVMLAAFALLIGLVAPANPERFRWAELPGQALLVHAWGMRTGAGWNLPTWSLSALVACYAVFPTLWRALSRVRSSLLLFGGGLVLIWAGDVACRALLHEDLYSLQFNFGVVRALPLFIFGAALARIAALDGVDGPAGRWAKPLLATAGIGVIALQALGRFDLLSMALLGIVIAAAGAARVRRGGAVMTRAGQLSFALYITHIFVAAVWFHALRLAARRLGLPEWAQWTVWSLSLPAALGAAVLFERFVDRPLQTLCKPLVEGLPHRGPTAPTPAPEASYG